jgi:hypothetical protein
MAAAPPFPATTSAVYRRTRPFATSACVIRYHSVSLRVDNLQNQQRLTLGYVGQISVVSNARAPKPTMVSKAQEMAKYAFPPMM